MAIDPEVEQRIEALLQAANIIHVTAVSTVLSVRFSVIVSVILSGLDGHFSKFQ